MEANEILKDHIHVYSLDEHEWEKDKLTMLPSGDMIDGKGNIHSAKNHLSFIAYGIAERAIEIVKDEMIERAADAYISTCADRVFGLCSTVSSRSPLDDDDDMYGCLGRDCLKVKEFIKKLEKDGK